jgi:hypothetical protein
VPVSRSNADILAHYYRCVVMLRSGWGWILPTEPHLTIMLKLVEALGAKAERAKRKTCFPSLCLVRAVREGKAEGLATL